MVSVAILLASAVAAPACGSAHAAQDLRTVHITIHHSAFDPNEIDVAPGETVLFVVENTDPIDHEFLVGNEQVQAVHELGTEAHHAPKPGEMSVPALTTRVTTYTFPTGTVRRSSDATSLATTPTGCGERSGSDDAGDYEEKWAVRSGVARSRRAAATR